MISLRLREHTVGAFISTYIAFLTLVPAWSIGLVKSFYGVALLFVIIAIGAFSFYFFGTFLKGWGVSSGEESTRFLLAGGSSTLLELTILNMLFLVVGVTSGPMFATWKTMTFLFALGHSYLWNKYWSFGAGSSAIGREFKGFFLSNLIGLILNVGIASALVSMDENPFGLSSLHWANVATAIAVIVTMVWNFLSYKHFVFKKVP